MTIDKSDQIEYLKKEEKRLEEAIDCYMAIDLADMAEIATQKLKAIKKKIEELAT